MNRLSTAVLVPLSLVVPLSLAAGCGAGEASSIELVSVSPTETGTNKPMGFTVAVPKNAKPGDCWRDEITGLKCQYRYRFDQTKGDISENTYTVQVLQPKKPLDATRARFYAINRAFGRKLSMRRKLANGDLLFEFDTGRLNVKVINFYKQKEGYIAVECTGPSKKHMANLRRMCASFKLTPKIASK